MYKGLQLCQQAIDALTEILVALVASQGFLPVKASTEIALKITEAESAAELTCPEILTLCS